MRSCSSQPLASPCLVCPPASLAKTAGYPGELLQCPELESAVNLAKTAVQRHQASSLLLSPACASFDQYRDFEARGDHFRTLITPLLDVA